MTLRWFFTLSLLLLCLAQGQQAQAQTLAEDTTAAQSGDASAQHALGMRYLQGKAVGENYAESAAWFARAAKQGHRDAQNQLGRLYFSGLGVDTDVAQAGKWLELAAQDGDAGYVFDLAKVLEANADTLPRAAALYLKAAEAGHVEASVSLGVLYQGGRGVEQDFARAISLYTGPAQAGHPRALNNLGLIYVRGSGVPQDYERAAEFFTAAAEAGLKTAMTNLGVLYENGFGVPLDEARAAELYRMGGGGDGTPTTQTKATAQIIYDMRLAAVETHQDALNEIDQRARAGDPVARFQMAWILMQSPDATFAVQQQAARLFQSGARAGHGPSMANLGVMYFRAQGLPQDYVLGYMWLLLAKSAGVQEASGLSAALSGKMTPAQINESQSRAQALTDAG